MSMERIHMQTPFKRTATGVEGVGCGGRNSKNCSNISENLPIKAANFFELDGGKQHFKLNEPNLARETSQGFSQ